MPDKEHPASKAGRYVRAAGIVVGKEIDRRSTAATAKPPPAPVAQPPPPPPAATTTFTGKTIFRFFVLSLVILGLTLLHAADAIPGSDRAIVRLAFSGILFVQALLLITNWQRANERIGQRVLTQMWGHRGAMNRRERAAARILRDGLILIGIVFLAAAVFELVVGLTG